MGAFLHGEVEGNLCQRSMRQFRGTRAQFPASARSASKIEHDGNSCRARLVDMQGDADGSQQSFKSCERDCAHVTPATKGIRAAFCQS